jgi:ABC transporter transmembrane region 2
MFRAAFLRRVPLFLRNFSENVVLCLAAASIESTIRRVTNQTKLYWRKQLTNRINTRYFADMVRLFA